MEIGSDAYEFVTVVYTHSVIFAVTICVSICLSVVWNKRLIYYTVIQCIVNKASNVLHTLILLEKKRIMTKHDQTVCHACVL